MFLFLSALGYVCSLKVHSLNLVSFLTSVNHRKNGDVVVFSFGGDCGAVGFGASWVSPIAQAS
ncbi:hypothetical protein CTT30_06070 [Vibrio coralliilyticus]|nr:hypothetical protein CTT30_06070 [Vibrio coralliilyticus]